MGRKSKKDIVLKAMRVILQEYNDIKHKNDISTCSLCILFREDDFRFHLCNNCPMQIFDNMSSVPCMQRKCYPIDCTNIRTEDNFRLQRVIRFYNEIITKIESMSNSEFLKTDYKFLVEIDNSIHKTFKITKKK